MARKNDLESWNRQRTCKGPVAGRGPGRRSGPSSAQTRIRSRPFQCQTPRTRKNDQSQSWAEAAFVRIAAHAHYLHQHAPRPPQPLQPFRKPRPSQPRARQRGRAPRPLPGPGYSRPSASCRPIRGGDHMGARPVRTQKARNPHRPGRCNHDYRRPHTAPRAAGDAPASPGPVGVPPAARSALCCCG